MNCKRYDSSFESLKKNKDIKFKNLKLNDYAIGTDSICLLQNPGQVHCWLYSAGWNDLGIVLKADASIKKILISNYLVCAWVNEHLDCVNLFNKRTVTLPAAGALDVFSTGYGACVVVGERATCYVPIGDKYVEWRQEGAQDVPQISMDTSSLMTNIFSCGLKNKKPVCWGRRSFEPKNSMSYLRLTVMQDYICGMNQSSIECSTFFQTEQLDMPSELGDLSNIFFKTDSKYCGYNCKTQLCGAFERGIACWQLEQSSVYGSFTHRLISKVTDLKGQDYIGGSFNFICGKTNHRVKCKGDLSAVGLPTENQNVRDISIFNNYACLIQNNKLNCSGSSSEGHLPVLPNEIVQPTKVSVGPAFSCVYDVDRIKCWVVSDSGPEYESKWRQVITPPQTLGTLIDLKVGVDHVCASFENGVLCWSGVN